MALLLSGACSYKAFLNGMLFHLEGTTASHSPFYESEDGRYFIYFDRDCDGAAPINVARWIIDTDSPNRTRHGDLDGDQHCKYLARTDAGDAKMPPASAEWGMSCGDGKWLQQTITLEYNGRRTTPTTTTSPQRTAVAAFELSGACALQSRMDTVFVRKGETSSGAPYYRSTDGRHYVYFDPDCSGKGKITNRWIVDMNEPNPVLDADLDKDEACLYTARTSGNKDGPPTAATWLMYCDGATWKEVSLSLIEIDASTVTEHGEKKRIISGQLMVVPGTLFFFTLVLLWDAVAPW